MFLLIICYVSARKRHDKDVFFQKSVIKVIKDHVVVKMKKGHIRRWPYEVGFKKFSENPAFVDIFNNFKENLADVLSN